MLFFGIDFHTNESFVILSNDSNKVLLSNRARQHSDGLVHCHCFVLLKNFFELMRAFRQKIHMPNKAPNIYSHAQSSFETNQFNLNQY